MTDGDAERARLWRDAHRDHVVALMDNGIVEYEPTGSDAARPELWKPAHWRWWHRRERQRSKK